MVNSPRWVHQPGSESVAGVRRARSTRPGSARLVVALAAWMVFFSAGAWPIVLPPAGGQGGLSFAQRVAAQEAIERVYYRHQQGATKPFEEAVPREALEAKVTRSLKGSLMLERYWNRPVTREALQAELDRIVRGTLAPDRLEEIFGALGRDPVLVQETFVRDVLVNRTLRGLFSADERIHGPLRRRTPGPQAQATTEPGGSTPARTPIPWESWWQSVHGDFDAMSITPVAARSVPLTGSPAARSRPNPGPAIRSLAAGYLGGDEPPCRPDAWDNGSLDDFPAGMREPYAFWTGSVVLLWDGATNRLLQYDPATDTWTRLSTLGAPQTDVGCTTMAWTGRELLVWAYLPTLGGASREPYGARYNPVTDTWREMAHLGGPTLRCDSTGVWTGEDLIIWGGGAHDENHHIVLTRTGRAYNAESDTWRTISRQGSPELRYEHQSAWVAPYMVVWGGLDYFNDPINTGGRYDPARDVWLPMSTTGAPVARIAGTMTAAAGEVIIWGGDRENVLGFTASGARYNPVTDTWRPTADQEAPQRRERHSALWTGDRLIIWGGLTDVPPPHVVLDTGAAYDPLTDSWEALTGINAPSARRQHAAVWTGREMLILGGDSFRALASGGKYDPLLDAWTPTMQPGGATGSAVWTGTRLLVWSGRDWSLPSGEGAAYDPVIDAWIPISSLGAPRPRLAHAAVWAGSEMIVAGGQNPLANPLFLTDGGRYDPATDSWRPIASTGGLRIDSRAVWTGSELMGWDGYQGARYDPRLDAWMPMTTQGAPSTRGGFSTIWTGTRLIVWGGRGNGRSLNDGVAYDPLTDSWSGISLVSAPEPREGHTAVWTGTEMIVWGGPVLKGGGRYDPAADTWRSMSVQGQPPGIERHTALWTGDGMIVWGGKTVRSNLQNGGAIYSPQTDRWKPMPQQGAADPLVGYAAIWTGREMIVWDWERRGGRFVVGEGPDRDDDDYRPCEGDCDDADATVYPGAPEVCNGRDDDCNGFHDDDGRHDLDRDTVGNACDNCPTVGNEGQSDVDADGAGDRCDTCLEIANPTQQETAACIEVTSDGGDCMEARIQTVQQGVSGEIRIVGSTYSAPDALTIYLNITSCLFVEDLEFLLNGVSLGAFTDDSVDCVCVPPLKSYTPDMQVVRGAWRLAGNNVITLRKPGAPSLPGMWDGTFFGWARAVIQSGGLNRLECLVDARGGFCTEPDQCVGEYLEDAFSIDALVAAPLGEEYQASVVPFSGSHLPGLVDLSGARDGVMRVCVRADLPGSGQAEDCVMSLKQGEAYLAINGAACDGAALDTDADGAPDLNDCRLSDPTVWAEPGEVSDVGWTSHPETLTWIAPASPGGRHVVYDVLKAPAPASFEAAASCLMTDGALTSVADPSGPPADSISYYLVRAENACPQASARVGVNAAAAPRPARTCP